MVAVLRDVYVSLHMEKHLPHGLSASRLASGASARVAEMKPSPAEYQQLKLCVYQLLCGLHERDSRRPFCPPRHWEMPHLNKITAPPDLFLETDDDEPMSPRVAPSVIRSAELLKRAPFVFPFEERVRFFRSLVMQSKRSIRGHLQEFLIGPSLQVQARRNHIYEDAFSDLSQGKDLRLPLKVMLVNAQGLDEPGIDGGGLFREFLSELLKTGFDPNRGYFTSTQDGQLYPNPQAPFLSDNYTSHYRFLGAMLGKAMYEHLLVEIPFAGFFLCKLADRGQGRLEAYHLASLDPELYRNVLSLKNYEGDLEDLDLNFTTISSEFGQSKVVELRPGGGDLPVTRGNCIQYIHLLADWRLNTSIDPQFRAFREGLARVVPLSWLRLFNQGELQVLISGAEVPIDINDLRANTKYAGKYKEDHESIRMFWEVVEGFTEQEKQQLLKFVTSCSRPPLLGFKDLFPPFCVMSGGQDDRLPSASTCMNLLKLPIFPDFKTLESRLKYALSSGAGFELS
jgi:ubiquitin-protein ligase E3 C